MQNPKLTVVIIKKIKEGVSSEWLKVLKETQEYVRDVDQKLYQETPSPCSNPMQTPSPCSKPMLQAHVNSKPKQSKAFPSRVYDYRTGGGVRYELAKRLENLPT